MKFRLFVWMFALLLSFGTFVSAQYYYFTGNGIDNPWFQQWCNEQYQIRFDTESSEAWAGIFHLVLDDTKISYFTWSTLSSNLFVASTLGFPDWAATYPKWWINYSMLEMERYHQDGVSTVSGDKPYGSILFVPNYSINTSYDVDFGMIYTSWSSYTTETTLSYEWADIINPLDQEIYLTWTIVVTQFPCEADNQWPNIILNVPSNSETNYITNNWLNIFFDESVGSTDVPYVRTGWVWTWDIGGNIWWINNQYGVDSGTVSVTVSWNSNNLVLNQISDFNRSPTNKTRQDKDRDYQITTGSLFDFGVENLIEVDISVDDRIWNSSTFHHEFNAPESPIISNLYPNNGAIYVVLNDIISFSINDFWAGVDTGTITVAVSGINNAASGYNYIYSGTDLSFVLNHGSEWLGNSWWYDVTVVNPVDFPATGELQVTVYGEDLKWNLVQDVWSFITRPSCDDMACCEPIILQTWDVSTQFIYPNSNLYISGGINAYLDWISWEYTGYIQCNNITWVWLDIYSGHEDFTSSFISFFEWSELVFSWDNYSVVFTGTNGQTALILKYGQFTFKVWPSDRSSSSNKWNTWKVLFYSTSDTWTVVHSGYLGTDTTGSWDIVYDVVSDTYYIVYKWQWHLASYISGVYITWWQEQFFDFTTWTNLYSTKQYSQSLDDGYRYQVAWDLRNMVWVYDGKINVNDITMIVTDECNYNNWTVDQYHKCNLNGDTKVNMADIWVIITNIWLEGPYLQSQEEFWWFGW